LQPLWSPSPHRKQSRRPVQTPSVPLAPPEKKLTDVRTDTEACLNQAASFSPSVQSLLRREATTPTQRFSRIPTPPPRRCGRKR
jgi:hypothetical protein